jgi:hypothetical protein
MDFSTARQITDHSRVNPRRMAIKLCYVDGMPRLGQDVKTSAPVPPSSSSASTGLGPSRTTGLLSA